MEGLDEVTSRQEYDSEQTILNFYIIQFFSQQNCE